MLNVLAGVGAAQAVSMVVGLVRTKLLAVLLGPAGVGITSVIDQTALIVLHVSALSLPFASVKFLSRAHSRGAEVFRRTCSSLFGAVVLATAAGAGLALITLAGWPELFGPSLAGYAPLLAPALLGIPAMALHGLFIQVLAAARAPRGSAVLGLLISVGLTAAAYLGIRANGIPGLYWASLVCNYLIVGGMLWHLDRRLGLPPFGGMLRVRHLFEDNRGLVTFTLISYGMTVALPLSHGMARYAVLTRLGERETGLLAAAMLLSGAFARLLTPLNGLYLTPLVNRDIPVEEKLRAAAEFQATLMMTLGLLAMPVLLFTGEILSLLFSPAFVEIGSVAYLFVVAECIALLAGVYQAVLIGLDDLKAYGILAGSAQLSLGVAAWALVPHYGIGGVAIGYLISSTALFGLTLARLRIVHGFVPRPRSLALIASGVLALLAAGELSTHGDPRAPLVIAVKVGVCTLVASGILLLWRRDRSVRPARPQGGSSA